MGPQSVDEASGAASSMICSFSFLASSRCSLSFEKWALRRRVYWVRAELKRFQSSLSVARSTRGSAFHSSRSVRKRSTPPRQSLPAASFSASPTIVSLAAMASAFASARAAFRASIWAGRVSSRASRRFVRAARSPTALASATFFLLAAMACFASSGLIAWAATRVSSSWTSVVRFSYLRT